MSKKKKLNPPSLLTFYQFLQLKGKRQKKNYVSRLHKYALQTYKALTAKKNGRSVDGYKLEEIKRFWFVFEKQAKDFKRELNNSLNVWDVEDDLKQMHYSFNVLINIKK